MKVVTAEEMREIDRITIERYGVPGSVLMERAGLSVAQRVRELFRNKRIVVLAGGGNNGGDGIAAGRNLHNWGWDVQILLMLREDKLSPDCLSQYRMAKQSGVSVEFRKIVGEQDFQDAVVVDALLGTGINKAVNSPMSDVIRFLNGSGAEVISVDIPSGISSDTGQIMGEAVRSHVTVTFGLPKMGHFLHPGAEHTGRLFIEDIGFPADVTEADTLLSEVMDKRTVSLLMPERRAYSHKGDYGHVLIVAGSRGKTGAALMAAKACLRSGAGLVTVGVADSLVDSVQGRVTEEMVLPLPDTGVGIISAKAAGAIRDFLEQKANVLAMGPGLSADRDIEMLVLELLENISAPIVLDADAINVLEGRKERFLKGKAPIILTPHAGEMTRIARSGPSPSRKDAGVRLLRKELEENRVGMTRSFAGEHGVHIVLKGAPTIIAEPGGKVRINTTGNPGMATAGAGDVLTGMIAALLGQGLNPFDASCSAVYLHGLAGDAAAREKGVHSLIASDIIEMIPQAFLSLTPHA